MANGPRTSLYSDKEERELMVALKSEGAWLQSGVDALKRAELNGYAYTLEEMNIEIDQLKERLQNK